ncbi:class I SAM-dependent methyltransferase [Companilactobacillus allii]|uniref:SAM-dependent methyltransferase n=1 Tax=Companilactobacillus allii TaxID=1847728 RepID=A0A1P8Q1K7_9LACO|nr:class I SAM-dependent methyltransferase [Companilactobacillus allii]APX71764.1 SAM-dependent methyltransferase [Companilactobacillus allii]USQ68851.1 class I SAM-dependent methyltransferase [Companilactobacillus allii]
MNNIYDNDKFFEKYSKMNRSINGLSGAGEWSTLKPMLPDFTNKDVLDLGCGYGWIDRYAVENNARSVLGVDLSEKMLAVAKEKTETDKIDYIKGDISQIDFEDNRFDIVISSLALHYVESFSYLIKKISKYLKPNGILIFSVEHPIFTAQGSEEWNYDENGNIKDFPVDNYFKEGKRETDFLGETVVKYHKTLTTYLDGLLTSGFRLNRVVEPMPPKNMMDIPGMKDELRRPMMLIISATNIK